MSYSMPMVSKPHRSRWGIWLIFVLLLIALFAWPSLSSLVTDWLWYKELGRTDIFRAFTWGPLALGIGVAIGYFIIVFANVALAFRDTTENSWANLQQRLGTQAISLLLRTIKRAAFWVGLLASAFFSMIAGQTASGHFSKVLLFLHAQRVGISDPVFHQDISFYLFRLPLWKLLASFLFGALILALILSAILYLATQSIRLVRNFPVFSPNAQRHMMILLGLLLLIKATQYYFDRFSLMTANTGVIVGPQYVDIHARIPGLMIMLVIAAFFGLLLIVLGASRLAIFLPVAAIIILLIASVLVLGVYPASVQRFRVQPNELALESPYINQHIKFTRQSFGLDAVIRQSFLPQARVTRAELNQAPGTVKNIRLWDYRPLTQVYSQLQDLRTYYDISNVDVDRYTIDGQMRQVMLAARELNINNIPGEKNWVKQHLIYTHGYGLVMSPVNEVNTARGNPTFFINDIPPQSSVSSLTVKRPEIYFGEEVNTYSIVRTGQKEFDYPGNVEDAYTQRYGGSAGISIGNTIIRAMAATRFGALDMLISDYVKPESRLIFRRQIIERVQAVAPFLLFDKDPYLVLGEDGKLYWMLDAYSASENYPYAQYTSLDTAGDETHTMNYLRNSAKVVVDAYNGTTTFYTVDEKEPILRAWRSVFPGMFKPLADLPAGLTAHIRFPEGLFNTLANVYCRYHMTQPISFFQQEDLWDIPQEASNLSNASSVSDMEAYYTVMSRPEQDIPEFLLIRPYTPVKKKNMIAWLSARSDPEHYGELLVYDLSKQYTIFGPEQIQASINQDPEISSAVSLWNQSGSQVLWGNLLVIPIGKTLLYVQPVYLQAERSQRPELQRVIVADQQQVVMRNTLAEALSALTGTTVSEEQPTPTTGQPPVTSAQPPVISVPTTEAERALARSAYDHFGKAQQALKEGNWAKYGQEMEGVRRDLESLNKGK